jgi:hypothetical protein
MNRIGSIVIALVLAAGFAACSDSNNPSPAPPPPPPPPLAADIALDGVVSDGPVVGGTLFLFLPEDIQAALDSVDPGGDRLAQLAAAPAVMTLTRDPADDDGYAVTVDSAYANRPLFLVFDNTDAEDDTFRDTPANLESVVVLGDAGATQRVNVSTQTTLIAMQVRAALDPDGDGGIIDDAAIAAAIGDATANVLDALATDPLGRDLYPAGFEPIGHEGDDEVHAASTAIGSLLRAAGLVEGASYDETLQVLALDAADGALDGAIPVALAPTPEQEALAEAVSDVSSAGSDEDIAMFAVGPCSSAAVSLQQACEVDTFDDLFEGTGICNDIFDDDDRADCMDDVARDIGEKEEECDDTFDARLQLCEELGDAPHEPAFGAAFAAEFVDPLAIGETVTPNPWFPLVTGNRWLYEGDGESIEVVVTDETKLIDGITCVVVIDTASEEGLAVEITRDWYAQDTDGNVWYCGEIARNFETFDGDEPATPELVDIEGSWKAGRDGAEAGILLPFDPQVGEVIRQEVAWGEAEDVVRIESLTATESAPGGACDGDCLMTADLTPLEPGVEENKFYVSGLGLIVEIDLETGDRVELVDFAPAP